MFTKTTTKQLWDGNGVDGVFNITDFYFVKNEHVKVSVYVGGASPAVEKTEDFDYTLTGAGDPDGGQITWIGTVPASGDVILAERVVPYTQESDYENFDGTPSDLLESDLDLAAMREQQLKDGLDRSVKVPVNIVGFNAELPATLTPGRGWKINASGDGIEETLGDPDDVAEQVAIAVASATASAASAAAAAASENNAAASATASGNSALLAQSWAVDDIVARPEGSAKYWSEQAQLIATTGDYITFGPAALTANQATGVDPIVLPVDPKIAARVTFNLGGVMQIAGTDFALDAAPDTINLRIVGGSSALTGVVYSGVVQLPSGLTNINAPSAGSVVETTIQNDAVAYVKMKASDLATTLAGFVGTKIATVAGVIAYVAGTCIGQSQTWQDVLSSRASGTTYTNSTGRPIMVNAWARTSTTGSITISLAVGGVQAAYAVNYGNGLGYVAFVSAIVPAGASYSVTTGGSANGGIQGWAELR